MALESAINKSVLTNLSPTRPPALRRDLLMANWQVTTFATQPELRQHEISGIGTLLFDTASGTETVDILNWCETIPRWKALPKVVIGDPGPSFSNLLIIPENQINQQLLSYLCMAQMQVQRKRSEQTMRRRYFRLLSQQPSLLEQNITLEDIGLGGAALRLPFPIPAGKHMHLRISNVPQLGRLEVEVVDSHINESGAYTIHVKFLNLNLERERLLRRYLLEEQMKQQKQQ